MANISDCRENRSLCGAGGKETVCIETNRILDSCRDRDCFENVRVYLTDIGNDIIERTGNVRTKEANIAWTYINIDPVRFNCGFYTVTIRFFVKLLFEACIGTGRAQEFEGIAVVEKKVILYGGESNVSVFRSSCGTDNFCDPPEPSCGVKNLPEAVIEVVDPIVLSTGVYEKVSCPSCCSCCCCGDIPESITVGLNGCLCDEDGDRYLLSSVLLSDQYKARKVEDLSVKLTLDISPTSVVKLPSGEPVSFKADQNTVEFKITDPGIFSMLEIK